jgi:myo-inositol 2-dehydrogenase/D-chiro-inositol 1-dehydrogenase
MTGTTGTLRLGLIGLGRIGSFHARTLSGLSAVGSLVITDVAPGLAGSLAAELGCESAASPAELLAAGIDGVVIAATTHAHPELLLASLEAGLPVFCEKPVAAAAADGAKVLRQAQQFDVPVQIGYPRRFDAGFMAVRAAVSAGELGWLHTIRSTTLDPAPPPAEYLRGSGGILRDCSVHDLDAVRWVSGQEVVEVYATGSNQGDPVFAEIGDVDTCAAVLTLTDGTLGVVSNSRYNAAGYDVRLEVHGSEGSMAAGLDDHLPLRSAEPGVRFPAGPPSQFFMDRLADAFQRELAAFTQVVAGTLASPCTIQDAVETGWVAEACTLSLREHRPVRVDDVRL